MSQPKGARKGKKKIKSRGKRNRRVDGKKNGGTLNGGVAIYL